MTDLSAVVLRLYETVFSLPGVAHVPADSPQATALRLEEIKKAVQFLEQNK